MGTSTAELPDTHEMVIVHRLFRREFRLLPDLVDGVADGDTARSAVVGDHCADMIAGLHHHHHGEDELLWPKLLDRASPQAELVRRMESQHEDMSKALDEAEAALPAWRASAGKAEGAALSAALRRMAPILTEHLDEEEREILPLVREHITVEEWKELGDAGVSFLQEDKNKLLVFLGALLEETSDAERAAFLRLLPLPARIAWKLLGRRKYEAYRTSVRAG